MTTVTSQKLTTQPPNQNGAAGQYIPAQFRNPSAEAQAALAGPHGAHAAAFIALQGQMNDTQSSVATHLERIRQLEGQIQHQDALKLEIATVRKQMEDSKREMEQLLSAPRLPTQNGSHGYEDDDDDDDARSVATVMPDDDDDDDERPPPRSANGNGARASEGASSNDEDLTTRIQTLTTEMSDALQLSKLLQAQHGEAMAAVKHLTERVGLLETDLTERVSAAALQAEERWEAWRSKFEDKWKKERESWESERERLRGVVREWEEASRRAVEEEEEREMNEQLSGDDELVDEEEDDGAQDVEEGELLAVHNRWQAPLPASDNVNLADVPPSLAKPRRRRPSAKTTLAMRSLRAVANNAGAATPKGAQDTPLLVKKGRSRELSSDALRRVKGRDRPRSGYPGVFNEKDSSESGRESADTLRGDKELAERKLDTAAQKQVPHVGRGSAYSLFC